MQDEEKYEQIILDVNSFSFDDLQKKIIHQNKINYIYSDENPNRLKPYHEYEEGEEIPKDRLIDGPEIFRIDPYYKYGKYAVSNYGRVKQKIGNDWILKKQYDCPEKGRGWLLVENTATVYVYQLVAETWLQRPGGKNWTIHHVTNDGYDNRPKNLIYLESSEHSKINHKPKDDEN